MQSLLPMQMAAPLGFDESWEASRFSSSKMFEGDPLERSKSVSLTPILLMIPSGEPTDIK